MNKAVVGVALSVAVIGLVGCGNKATTPNTGNTDNSGTNVAQNDAVAKVGDAVKVDYVGTLEDGTMFDTSIMDKAKQGNIFDETRPYEPLTVNLGKGEVIPGFENGLVGMKVGETKKITLTPDQAYQEPKAELIQKVPVDTFSGSNIVPEVGKTYNFGIAQGTIVEVTPTEITIDFNHPLAGKTLTFEVTVKDIIAGGAGEIQQPTADIPTVAEENVVAEAEDQMPVEDTTATTGAEEALPVQ